MAERSRERVAAAKRRCCASGDARAAPPIRLHPRAGARHPRLRHHCGDQTSLPGGRRARSLRMRASRNALRRTQRPAPRRSRSSPSRAASMDRWSHLESARARSARAGARDAQGFSRRSISGRRSASRRRGRRAADLAHAAESGTRSAAARRASLRGCSCCSKRSMSATSSSRTSFVAASGVEGAAGWRQLPRSRDAASRAGAARAARAAVAYHDAARCGERRRRRRTMRTASRPPATTWRWSAAR